MPGPDRRHAIVSALGRLLPTLGFERASIQKIAAEADVLPGLVHYYFPNKLAILEALVVSLSQRLEDRLGDWDDADSLLGAALATGAGHDAEGVALFVAVLSEASRQPAVARLLHATLQSWTDRLARTLDGDQAHAAALIATIVGMWQVGTTFPGLIPADTAYGSAVAMRRGLR